MQGQNPPGVDDSTQEKRRRDRVLWIVLVMLGLAMLLCTGQVAMESAAGEIGEATAGSAMRANYEPWTPIQFGALDPRLAFAVLSDVGGEIPAILPYDGCLVGEGTCLPDTAVPTVTPTAPSGTPPATETPTGTFIYATSTTTGTPAGPAATSTQTPTVTQTPTPTPKVFPVKVPNPENIPPGTQIVHFEIVVINYGSLPPAYLTQIIDRLPSGMTYVCGTGSPPPDGACSGSDTTITW
ncbi:MAG: hypothetical protein PVG63_08605, partial [Anaerolineales bacterium]